MNSDNIIVNKSYLFALEIIELYKFLVEKKEYVLSKQILRSGTSVGANIHEALTTETKKDFIYKLGVSKKENKETSYWLNLLLGSGYISSDQFNKLNELSEELNR